MQISTLLDYYWRSTCLFNAIVIDLAWVTCLLQSITDCCRRSCKITNNSLLDLDIGSHGDCSEKLFGSHKYCCDSQWPLTSSYFKFGAMKWRKKIKNWSFCILSHIFLCSSIILKTSLPARSIANSKREKGNLKRKQT